MQVAQVELAKDLQREDRVVELPSEETLWARMAILLVPMSQFRRRLQPFPAPQVVRYPTHL